MSRFQWTRLQTFYLIVALVPHALVVYSSDFSFLGSREWDGVTEVISWSGNGGCSRLWFGDDGRCHLHRLSWLKDRN